MATQAADGLVAAGYGFGTARCAILGNRGLIVCRGDLSRSRSAHLVLRREEDGAYLLFTSGSSGVPKGVLVRNRNVMLYLRSVAQHYMPTADDRCTQLFDLTFDLSAHDMFLCWGAGATLFRVPDSARFSPRDFVRRNALMTWFPCTEYFGSDRWRLRRQRNGDGSFVGRRRSYSRCPQRAVRTDSGNSRLVSRSFAQAPSANSAHGG